MATLLQVNCGAKVRFAIVQLSLRTIAAVTTTHLPRHYSTDNNNNGNSDGPEKAPITSVAATPTSDSTTPTTPKAPSATDATAKNAAKKIAIKSIPDRDIKKSVFISQSYDIFTNLALEDWFYRNFDFTNHHVLMLWSNDPCVVVGRHQNPFLEANITRLQKAGIELARRNSGGGTVYHDRGNMNLTFFTPRERYDRTYNLNIITRALFREWGIKADISKRDDITLYDKKVIRMKLNSEIKIKSITLYLPLIQVSC